MRRGILLCLAVMLLASPALAERWRSMATSWAEAAGCVPGRVDLIAITANEEVYTVTCREPATSAVTVRCSRYRLTAPVRPPLWCDYAGYYGPLPIYPDGAP